MTKIHRARLGAALFLILSVGYGVKGAEACDSRVTTRPGDLWGRPSPVVRDHRNPYGSAPGGVIVTSTPRDPIVRDHRSPPVVRDHRW
ncbi:hypothetical protein [Microvirga calopogonii]|uniref:hypothetical protein n=1 Tax=Microvirga calopogonii TaxID=2078013 RepID=UPI000E0D4894|nr:hypothetical protein [Microvirga calopogonii]